MRAPIRRPDAAQLAAFGTSTIQEGGCDSRPAASPVEVSRHDARPNLRLRGLARALGFGKLA
jgi:hypothetical protein